jgi:hypothetical protein
MIELNGRGIPGEEGHPWTRATAHQVLTNPKYIGAKIYNRRSFKLKHRRVNNPTQMWIWRDGAFDPIVTPSIFERARAIIESLTTAEPLNSSTAGWSPKGRLIDICVDATR